MGILRHIFPERIGDKVYKAGGLKTEKQDPRDFQLGSLWGFSYKPKHERWELPTVSIKDQGSLNTCTQASATVQKEKDEEIELSEQSLTCFAKAMGLITGDGFSTLTNIQKAVKEYGIARKSLLNGTRNWSTYSSAANLTKEVRDDAAKHKSLSYWSANSRDEKLKALDEGHILHTGMTWYSGFNMYGGFTAPFIIYKNSGVKVGGHAVVIIGYDMEYYGKKVYILQNSYGSDWGDKGRFYVDMDFFDTYGHAAYAQKDIPVDTGKFLRDYTGKQVKAKGDPKIYLIQNGKKRSFGDGTKFKYLFFGKFGPEGERSYEMVDPEILSQIPEGEEMKPEESPIWDKLKGLWPSIKGLNDAEYWTKLETLLEEYGQIKEQINSLMK